MGSGPWENSPPDPAEKQPPDFSGFVLFVIGIVLLGVAGWALMNWTLPEVRVTPGSTSVRRFLYDNPIIYLALIGLVLLAGQFFRKK
ncbi:MAG TPA: hypothetical protein VJS85_09125 [Rhizomicrobium sp.]|nr:hypothetical protein [Rhizomicrobium sp.]